MTIPRILAIAGSDSGGGAGIQADVKTITMLGGHAMTAITAITAQNTLGVTAVHPVPAEAILAQIDAVVSDIGVDAVKIGMIGSAFAAEQVALRLQELREEHAELPIVFDPVMVATSGSVLADKATIAAFGHLMDLSAVVTPNLPELQALVGDEIATIEDVEAKALWLSARHDVAVLAKGGHLPGADVTDVLVERDESVQRWTVPRLETAHTHGTGCTLASGIATGLGSGLRLAQAVDLGRRYVQATLRAAPGFGGGHGPVGHALGIVAFDLIHSKNK